MYRIRTWITLRKVLRDCTPIFEAVLPAKKIAFLPLPRYLAGKCCSKDEHISNFGDSEYADEVLKISAAAKAAYNAAKPPGSFALYTLSDSDLLHSAHYPSTDGSDSVWRDPVHFRGEVYASIAADLATLITTSAVGDGEAGQPTKRLRIDSVAPPVICTSSHTRGRIATPSWLMGRAIRSQIGGNGRGRGRGPARARGRGGGRGGWRGFSRGPNPYSWRGRGSGYASFVRGRGR